MRLIKRNIRQYVDGFACERIYGAGVLPGMFESAVSEMRGNGLDIGTVVEGGVGVLSGCGSCCILWVNQYEIKWLR